MELLDRRIIARLRELSHRIAPKFEAELPGLSPEARQQLLHTLEDATTNKRAAERRSREPWRP